MTNYGVIKSIEEVELDDVISEGYKITTNTGVLLLLIDNYQLCREGWGHISSEEDFEDFIGCQIDDVRIVDEDLCNLDTDGWWAGGAMFINLETVKGTLQFALYNEHNGYYGHVCQVKWNHTVIAEDTL